MSLCTPETVLGCALLCGVLGLFWVTRFMMEMSGCADALKCFVTKQGHKEAILGIPVTTTMNPKTGELDYMCVVMCEGGQAK